MIDSFFGVHPQVMRSGLCAKMKPGEVKLYLYLMHESERYRTRQFRRTDAKVRETVGTAERTLCNARKRLQEYGLIQCTKTDGNKYLYTICNALTGQPYPGDPKTPARLTKATRPQYTASAKPVQTASTQERPLEAYGLPGVFDR